MIGNVFTEQLIDELYDEVEQFQYLFKYELLEKKYFKPTVKKLKRIILKIEKENKI